MRKTNHRKAQPQSAAQVQALNQRLTELGQRFVQLSAQGDFAAALAVNEQARRIVPRHPQILGDAALCHLRLGDREKGLVRADKGYALAKAGRDCVEAR